MSSVQARLRPDGLGGHPWLWALPLCAALAACSPALDWREVRTGGDHVQILMPCKPAKQERTLELAQRSWSAALSVCEARDLTFAVLALTPATSGAAVPAGPSILDASVLDTLVQTSSSRWGDADGAQTAPEEVRLPDTVQGRWARLSRQVQSGQPVLTQALFFAHQGRLFQLSVSGPRLGSEALEPFFGALKVIP